jgi:hypothetical protein
VYSPCIFTLFFSVDYRSSQDAADELLDCGPGDVHVEAPDYVHPGVLRGIPLGGGEILLHGLEQKVSVYVVLCGDRDDGGVLGRRALHELVYLVVVADGVFSGDDVDLVLGDDDVLQADRVDGGQVLPGLGLGAALVGRDDQDGAVHHRRPAQHGGHEDLVARGVHEADGPLELGLSLALGARG